MCYERGVGRSNGDVGMRKGCIGVRQDGVGGWCNGTLQWEGGIIWSWREWERGWEGS